MDNKYFEFLSQQVQPSLSSLNSDNDMVNLTIRVNVDCQVLCDGDFLYMVPANQIVKEKFPQGQHILQFASLEDSKVYEERIVDYPVAGKSYLIVADNLACEEDKNPPQIIDDTPKIDNAINALENGRYQEAFSDFSRLSKEGNKEAQYYLGLLYYEGKGVEKDVVEAESLFEKSSKQGYGPASCALGNCNRDIDDRFEHELGQFRGFNYDGDRWKDLRDVLAKYSVLYNTAISCGCEDAYFEMFLLYYIAYRKLSNFNSLTIKEIKDTVIDFARKSLKVEDIRAIVILFVRPDLSYECRADYELFERLGLQYEPSNKLLNEFSREEINHYLKVGAERGNKACIAQQGYNYLHSQEYVSLSDINNAIRCFKVANTTRFWGAVGLELLKKKEYSKASEYFEEYFKSGNFSYEYIMDCSIAYADLLVSGQYIAQDYKKAFELYQKVWDNRTNGGAVPREFRAIIGIKMGEMYEYGRGTQIDYPAALKCYLWAFEGCKEYAGKPIQTEELREKIDSLKKKVICQ